MERAGYFRAFWSENPNGERRLRERRVALQHDPITELLNRVTADRDRIKRELSEVKGAVGVEAYLTVKRERGEAVALLRRYESTARVHPGEVNADDICDIDADTRSLLSRLTGEGKGGE